MPPRTPPLIMLSTDGNTPYREHLHYGDAGHTLMIGPTRYGKSFALAQFVAQWLARHEDGQVLAFDKKASQLTLCTAVNGLFFDFRPSGKPLCPLGKLDTPEDLAWAHSYLDVLYRLGGTQLTPRQRQEVSDALLLIASRKRKSLTDFATATGSNELKTGLSHFTLGSVSGGAMLDGQDDRLDLGDARFVVFDMDFLFNLKDRRLLQAVLPYLFQVVLRRLDGRPTLITFDECWMGLDDPVFEGVLKSWVKELAKLNATLLLATQNLTDFTTSPLRHVVLDQCEKRIILPTPSAATASRQLFREELQLSDEQCAQIAVGTKQQDYFITDGKHFRRVQLNAHGVQKAFLGANSPKEQRQFQAMMKADPIFGAADWLRSRGEELAPWADKLEEDLREYSLEASYACA